MAMGKGAIGFIALLFLTACGGGNNPPPPPSPLPVPLSGWAMTEWGIGGVKQPMVPLSAVNLAIPMGPVSVNWISYVELAWKTPLAGSALRLDYTITGTSPVFVNDSAGNTCTPANPSLSLIIHQIGDQGTVPIYQSYRWFSTQALQTSLALGTFSVVVPLQISSWINVNGQSSDAAGWSGAIANPAAIGFVLGGGCFAGHGVALAAGSAVITVNGLNLQ